MSGIFIVSLVKSLKILSRTISSSSDNVLALKKVTFENTIHTLIIIDPIQYVNDYKWDDKEVLTHYLKVIHITLADMFQQKFLQIMLMG